MAKWTSPSAAAVALSSLVLESLSVLSASTSTRPLLSRSRCLSWMAYAVYERTFCRRHDGSPTIRLRRPHWSAFQSHLPLDHELKTKVVANFRRGPVRPSALHEAPCLPRVTETWWFRAGLWEGLGSRREFPSLSPSPFLSLSLHPRDSRGTVRWVLLDAAEDEEASDLPDFPEDNREEAMMERPRRNLVVDREPSF